LKNPKYYPDEKGLYYYCHNLKSCYLALSDICQQLNDSEEAENYLKDATNYFKSITNERSSKENLLLTYILANERFLSVNKNVYKKTLEKININELNEEDLVIYYYCYGKYYKCKKNFKEALNNFEKAKELMIQKLIQKYWDISDPNFLKEKLEIEVEEIKKNIEQFFNLWIINKIYLDVGKCYEELKEYEKAVENYMIYLDLQHFIPDLETDKASAKEYGIYGAKFFNFGFYKEARQCFLESLKREQKNAMNLSKLAGINYRLGRLEEVINNLEEALKIRSNDNDKKNLEKNKNKLRKRNEILEKLKSICGVANLCIEEKEIRKLSENKNQIEKLLKEIKDAMKYANMLQEEDKNAILEILKDIYTAATHLIEYKIKMLTSTIKSRINNQWRYKLSDEWGKIGWKIWQINKEIFRISWDVAEKCFELSVKIRPKNSMSWHNLGWVRYYIGLYTGNNSYFDKARNAFNTSIKLEERGVKEKNHIVLAKAGIGKIYEAEKDVPSAINCFNDSAEVCLKLYGKDNKKSIKSLIKTAESLRNLIFLNIDKKYILKIYEDMSKIYKDALEVAKNIKQKDTQTLLLIAKKILLEKETKKSLIYIVKL
jgi:tetratricopeptide (TPR) repeat protein